LSLDHEEHRVCRYGVFKVHADDPAEKSRPRGRSLKTQQRVVIVEVDMSSRRARAPDESARPRHRRAGRLRELELPRSLERR